MNTDAKLLPLEHPGAWRTDQSSRDSATVKLAEKHLQALDRALKTAQKKRPATPRW
ncbi:MAG: hypothetical protein OEO19_02695 [Gammaproteobacteria bacterium]|nr:hypothetical protein [Gammaproteobacteria bacterium]MDH3449624.1 hypothetical protein [Gammaproteobacteria bacterium]